MKVCSVSLLLACSVVISVTEACATAPALTGHILDATHGTPVIGASVAVVGGDSTHTGSDGSFRIPHVRTKERMLQVVATGYPTLRIPSLLAPQGVDLKVGVKLRSVADENAAATTASSSEQGAVLYVVFARRDSELVAFGAPEVIGMTWTLKTPGPPMLGRDTIDAAIVVNTSGSAALFGPAGARGAVCIALKTAAVTPRTCWFGDTLRMP
jgi:hypothetical protein